MFFGVFEREGGEVRDDGENGAVDGSEKKDGGVEDGYWVVICDCGEFVWATAPRERSMEEK